MEEVISTTGRRPARSTAKSTSRRPWMDKSTMPHLPIFGNEPVCGDPAHGLDDILLSGSDDEHYESPSARSRCLEEQACLFLEGRRPFLLSASLRGPFGRDTGWENPWRGRGGKVTKNSALLVTIQSSKPQRAPTSTSDISTGSRKRTAASTLLHIVPQTRCVSNSELGATPSITYADKDPELKKRAASADWLRRKNLKRMRPNYDALLTASPTVSRSIKAASFAKVTRAPKALTTARSFSEPVRDATTEDAIEDSVKGIGGDENTLPSQRFVGLDNSLSHISDSERSMSVPSGLLWDSRLGDSRDSCASSSRRFSRLQKQVVDNNGITTANSGLPSSKPGGWTTELRAGDTQFESQKDDSVHFKKRVSKTKKEDLLLSGDELAGSPSEPALPQPPRPSDVLANAWPSHAAIEPLHKETATIHFGPDTASSVEDNTPTTFYDDTTLLLAEQDGTKPADEEPMPCETSILGQNIPLEGPDRQEIRPEDGTAPKINVAEQEEDMRQEIVANTSSNELSNERTTSYFADTTATTSVMDTEVDEETAPPTKADDPDMDDRRLATEEQSPWAKTQPSAIADDTATYDEANPPSIDEQEADCEDRQDPTASTVQSPWSKETPSQLPISACILPNAAFEKTGKDAPDSSNLETSKPNTSLSQNPWAEVNTVISSFSSSLTNLPTSPCSPDKEPGSLQPSNGQRHHLEHVQEPYLPSLPIPIPTVPSSGTAPSTPETKQSSLPTPDMTVSIKSFRRFHSPSPTPPPHRRSTKAGSLRSVLVPPRRRSGAVTSVTKSGRRVHFALLGDKEVHESSGGLGGRLPHNSKTQKGDEDYIKAGLSRTSQDQGSPQPTQRAASPPPHDSTLVESLPSEVDRFKGHFASVVGRTRDQQAVTSGAFRTNTAQSAHAGQPDPVPITPLERSEAKSLDIYSSPSVDAMAARFLEVDAETSKLQQIQPRQSSTAPRFQDSNTSDKLLDVDGGDKENAWSLEAEQRDDNREDDPSSAVDDVQEVMDNLDDFLGLWDMDAELAQARTGRL